MRRSVTALFAVLVLTTLTHAVGAKAQLCAPRDGVELPPSARERLAADPAAFSFGRAWFDVTERAATARRAMQDGALARGATPAVSGTFRIPVIALHFSDTAPDSVPWPTADLEAELFDGLGASLTDYYDEISGGRLTVNGDVIGWTALSENTDYYAGSSNGLGADAKIGELIRDSVLANDAAIDWGLYDNDGPDGVPNSGDDDGYVDFVAFVHPDVGGECGDNPSIWSHRWRYVGWAASGGLPLETNDAAADGGVIRIDDYVIQPGLACGGAQMIQIGVFCHEFGHAFGLPDLYDINGGGANGLGHWCLMSAGNWNDPDSPAHMSAWTAAELGWVDVVDVGAQPVATTVQPVADTGVVYRLPFDHDRWRVRTDCAIDGTASMVVGATDAESTARGWAQPKGYGNHWVETVARDFHFDGSGPVTLQYDYAVDTEGGYDFVFALIEVDGVESSLKVHSGQASGTETFDLTSYLGAGPTDYRVKFRLRSDGGWSNEDGSYVASCAAFALDAVSVSGGGEIYATGFEQNRAGWFCPRNEDDNPVREYWLVENRRRRGFDQHLKAEGLMIYHVDHDVMSSSLGNSGGSDDAAARGVVVEEADGQFNLLAIGAANRGDAGDPWPSATATSFGPATTPGTGTNDGTTSVVEILSMVENGDDVDVVWRAGNPAPVFTAVTPATADADGNAVTVELVGASGLAYGATVRMVAFGEPALEATDVEWIDHDVLRATFAASAADAGTWDVVVENPDGQNVSVAAAFTWTAVPTDVPTSPRVPTVFALERNVPNPFNPATTLRFAVPRTSEVSLRVYDARGRQVATLVDGTLEAGYQQVRWDGRDARGDVVASGVYFARMVADDFVQTQKMLLSK